MSTYIPSGEIKQPSFHADELGFVFTWNGHLLRGIYPDAVTQAKQYFDSGFVEEIVSKRLFPKTWISEFENEQFGLIIEHELIQPVTYATEWNFEMLKDAALLVLEIAQVGQKYGYDMIDCHKLNVMFHHNRPLYVDLGSFIPAPKGSSGWRPFASFLRSYYYILDVWSSGASQMAKRMMAPHVELSEYDYFVFKSMLYRLFPLLLKTRLKIDNGLCALVNMSNERVKKNFNSLNHIKEKTLFFAKKIVTTCKLAPSLRLHHYAKKIKNKQLLTCSNEDTSLTESELILVDLLNKEYPDCKTVTVINNSALSFYEEVLQKTKIKKIYSLQENGTKSCFEYKYYQQKGGNISSLNVILSGSEILVRDKLPENRLSSEIVLLPQYSISNGSFGVHNALIQIEFLMKFASMRTIIITTCCNIQPFVESCQQYFNVKIFTPQGESYSNSKTKGIIINAIR